jgi:eukaryotic-like serine/threonine-protein kinase
MSPSASCVACGRTLPVGAATCPWDGTPASGRYAFSQAATEPAIPSLSVSRGFEGVGEPPSPSAASPDDPLIGAQLGDFLIRRRLGQGGMGIVYAGEQPVIGKQVAIKVLRPEIARDPEQVQRLLAEARAVNAIRHRGIIDIFNFGELPDGRHYVVMEYLRGQPLDELIARRGALPLVEVLDILDEVMAALGAGHETGIIHRDLKPSNIYLVSQPDNSRYVKLLDFGLAKQSAVPRGATPQTRTDMFVGTPEYVAPEQARAEPVGPYTDLYAAGVVTFEMLTGRLPFEANAPIDFVIKHLEETPKPPSRVVQGVPSELDALVLRMLEKEPRRRPASCDAVRREIARIRRALSSSATNVMRVTPPHSTDSLPAQPHPTLPLGTPPILSPSASGAATIRHPGVPMWIGAALFGAALLTLGVAVLAPGGGIQRMSESGPLVSPVQTVEAVQADAPPPKEPPPPATEVPKANIQASDEGSGGLPEVDLRLKPATAAKKSGDQSGRKTPAQPQSDTPSDVPDRDELLREIDRLEQELTDRSDEQTPPESVIALLRQYRSDARVAEYAEERRELARRLEKFESRFVSGPVR